MVGRLNESSRYRICGYRQPFRFFTQCLRMKPLRTSGTMVALAFLAAGLFAPSLSLSVTPSSSAVTPGGMCSANNVNDIEYLIFWPPLPGATFGSSPEVFARSIKDFAAKLGTTGDGKTRQLGFGASIPVFVSDESQIPRAIKQLFDMARQTNVAVHFNVDDHIEWDERPDLWNWYDPAKKGYSPDNRKNVEWYDWEGTPNRRRYITPAGVPSQSPHMCYNSPAVQQEIRRILSRIIGPALKEEIHALKKENREYLFAGLTVGAEAGFDDYSVIPNVSEIPPGADPMQRQMLQTFMQAAKLMDEDKAPRGGRLGYCSLTNAGYGKTHPPADIPAALADVNRQFIAFWDKQFADAGIPCSRIYTHVAASPPQDAANNAPLGIVFNPYARPGWTTYPQGTLGNGFQPLYDALAAHGNPAWGGVEANAASFGDPHARPALGWEEYLAWHYNHGAKLVGINTGASDPSLMSYLGKGAFGEEGMAAYRKFLRGEPLIESRIPHASGMVPAGLQEKIHAVQAALPQWLGEHGSAQVEGDANRLKQSMEEQRFDDANAAADALLKTMGK